MAMPRLLSSSDKMVANYSSKHVVHSSQQSSENMLHTTLEHPSKYAAHDLKQPSKNLLHTTLKHPSKSATHNLKQLSRNLLYTSLEHLSKSAAHDLEQPSRNLLHTSLKHPSKSAAHDLEQPSRNLLHTSLKHPSKSAAHDLEGFTHDLEHPSRNMLRAVLFIAQRSDVSHPWMSKEWWTSDKMSCLGILTTYGAGVHVLLWIFGPRRHQLEWRTNPRLASRLGLVRKISESAQFKWVSSARLGRLAGWLSQEDWRVGSAWKTSESTQLGRPADRLGLARSRRLVGWLSQIEMDMEVVMKRMNLYQAVAYIEASAVIYQDGKILIEVDHLQAASCPFLQIKGTNKEVVSTAASILSLHGSYTTKSYLQIILESLPDFGNESDGIHNHQAARLQDLVEFIQTQAGNLNYDVSTKEILPRDAIFEDLNCRIRKLERWNTINMVFWTILMSAIVGYSLYQRKRH
ncbi:hypothetical protein ZIOFF_068121 [Zingiber officinale]|uniref:Uncharacterized protein n=1 Tax=Zingiber officinale TaxID=94328 RepID=A0A8J5ERM2_ZINOF|nr:hypothetical protein ZIOFF_068121 [Zingiber officinale]